MLIYTVRRVVQAILVIVAVVTIVFLIIRVGPGDPAVRLAASDTISLGRSSDVSSLDHASPERMTEVRSRLGLDRPIGVQFATWIGALAQGDFGESFVYHRPVAELIGQRLGPTLSLALFTAVIAIVAGLPLGIAAAWRSGGVLDRALLGFCVLGFSIPVFVAGYLLVYLFAVKLDWFPVQGYQPLAAGVGLWAWHLVLPSLSIAIAFIALLVSMTRASLLEVLDEDYIRTARAKGLGEWAVLTRHALLNAANPILTVVGVGVTLLIAGVVVTESIFNIPGLGRLTVDAVLAGDYPVVQGVVFMSALACVTINFMIDVGYGLLDPRLRT